MNGEANDVLLWPLGGLAYVEVPNTARANFVTAAGGPLVNLGLCLLAAGALASCARAALGPPWNPLRYPAQRGGEYLSDGLGRRA